MIEGTKISVFELEGITLQIPVAEGHAVREKQPQKLGSRYVCAQEIQPQIPKFATNIPGQDISQEEVLKEGFSIDSEGNEIYFGCGTEVMCIKPSPNQEAIMCCGIPMTLKGVSALVNLS